MNVFDLTARILFDSSEFRLGLSEAGATAVAFAKAAIDEFAKVGKAFAGLAQQSLNSYSNYEQLVGGVETLFKDSSKKVFEYAENAYKTAGLSANEYMEQAINYSASLIQGLGGDTAKAAEIANIAITDMSDNVNKMGTTMEMAQNAYRGLSMGNFMMLDNLKLGYKGTAAEMARLINDSGVMGKAFQATAENVKEISFDKYIEAIHVIQKQMGITGTTAEEAADTIEGSTRSMAAAWENLLTEIAKDDGDIEGQLDILFESIANTAPNTAKRLGKILENVIAFFLNDFPEKWNKLKSKVKESVLEIWSNIDSSLSERFPKYKEYKEKIITAFETVKSAVKTVWSNIKDNFGKIRDKVIEVKDRLSDSFESIKDKFAPIVDKFKELKEAYDENGGAVGAFTDAVDFLSNALSNLLEFFTLVVESAVDFVKWLDSDTESANAYKTMIGTVVGALAAYEAIMVSLKVATLAQVAVTKIAAAAQALFNGVLEANPIGIVVVAIGALIGALVALYNNNEEFRAFCDEFFEMWKDGWEQVKEFFRNFVEAWKDGWETIKEKWSDFWDVWADGAQTIVDWFNAIGDFCKNAWQWGKDFINGLVGGIKSGWNELEDIGGKIYDFLHPGQSDSTVNEDEVFQNPYETETAADFIARTGTKGVPSGMTFYGDGGIVTKPTIAMIGEDGAEAVVPLEKDSETGRMFGGVTITFGDIYVQGGENAGDEVVRQIDEALRIYQIQQSRGIGGAAWQK